MESTAKFTSNELNRSPDRMCNTTVLQMAKFICFRKSLNFIPSFFFGFGSALARRAVVSCVSPLLPPHLPPLHVTPICIIHYYTTVLHIGRYSCCIEFRGTCTILICPLPPFHTYIHACEGEARGGHLSLYAATEAAAGRRGAGGLEVKGMMSIKFKI